MSRFGGYGRGGSRFGADPYYRQDAHQQSHRQASPSASGIGGWPRPGRGRGGYGTQDNRQTQFSSRNKQYEPRISGNNNNARPPPLLGASPSSSTLLKSGTTTAVPGIGNETDTVKDNNKSANSTQEVTGQQTKSSAVKSGLLPTPNISTAGTKLTKSNNGDSNAMSKSVVLPNAQGKQTTAALLLPTTTSSISTTSSSTTSSKSILKVNSTTSVSKSIPSTTIDSTNTNVKGSSPEPKTENSSYSEEEENYCSFCKIKFKSTENYTKHTRGLMHTQKVMEVENSKKGVEKEAENHKDSLTPSGKGSPSGKNSPSDKRSQSSKSSQSFIKQNPKNTPKSKTENTKIQSLFDIKVDLSYDKDPALAKFGLSKELLDTANLEPVIKPPKERDLNPEECGKKRFHNDYNCKLCNVKCTGAQSFQAHLAGNKHSTNVENYYNTGKSTVKRTDVSLVPCNRKSLTKELTSIITEPIVGLSYVTEFHKEDAKSVVNCVCNLCESKCDEHTIVPHLLGNRHRLNYMKEHHLEFHDHCKKYGGKKNQTQYIAELTQDIEKIDGKGEPSVKMCLEEKFVEEVYASETLLTTRRPPLLKRPGPAGDRFDGIKRSKVDIYDESKSYQGEGYDDYGYDEPMKWGPRRLVGAVPSNDYHEVYGDDQYGQDQYGYEDYGSGQYGNEKYDADLYGNDQYEKYVDERYSSDQFTNEQYVREGYGSDGHRRDEYPHSRGEIEEKDRYNQDGYLTKEDIYRMDPYSEHSNDGYTSRAPVVKEYGHVKEGPRSMIDDIPKSRELLLDEFSQSRDQSYGSFSKSKEPLIRNPPLLGRDPSFSEPLLKDPPLLKEPLLKNPPLSREPLLNQPSSRPACEPSSEGEYDYDRSRSWDNTNTQSQRSGSWDTGDKQPSQRSGSWDTGDKQPSQRSGLWDTGDKQQSQRSGSWDSGDKQPSQRSGLLDQDAWQSQNLQSDYNYSGQSNNQSSYNDGAGGRYTGYPQAPNEPPVPPVPQEAPPLPSKSYEEELAERRREEKLIEERIEKEVQNRLQNILSMKKPDPDRKSNTSGGMSDMSVLMQSLSNSLISNEDEAEMALQVSNALTQALLKYRLKTLPPEMVKDALPNYGDIVSQLEVSQSQASSKSLKLTPATPDSSYFHIQDIPGLMPTSQWPVTSNTTQIPMQVEQYNAMSQWSQKVQPGNNHLANQQSQYMQQTPAPLMPQHLSPASQPLISSSPVQIVQHATGYAKKKASNSQKQQQFMTPSSSTPPMVPPVSESLSSASILGDAPKSYFTDVPPEYLHHRLMQGPPSVSRPPRRH